MKRSFRRRRILVDAFQVRLLWISLLYFLVILLILASLLFTPLALGLRDSTLSMSAQVEVADQFLTLHQRIWPALLITFGLLAAHSVFISHRIAGPLYQFRRILKAVHDGDLTKRSSIRAHDYLHKEEAVINGMITVLSVRVRDIDEQSWKLRAGLGDLEQAIDGATADTLRERIGSLKARAERLQACVDQFTTDAEEGRAQDHVAGHAATASLRETEPYASGAR